MALVFVPNETLLRDGFVEHVYQTPQPQYEHRVSKSTIITPLSILLTLLLDTLNWPIASSIPCPPALGRSEHDACAKSQWRMDSGHFHDRRPCCGYERMCRGVVALKVKGTSQRWRIGQLRLHSAERALGLGYSRWPAVRQRNENGSWANGQRGE